MHQDSDNAMLLLACRPRWLNKQEAQSGLSLAPFGLYIYLLKRPAAPLSAQIKSHHDCASSERDARENEPQGCPRLFPLSFTLPVLFTVLLYG